MKAVATLAAPVRNEGSRRTLPANWLGQFLLLLVLAIGVIVTPAQTQSVVLVGSGSTVPAPLYTRWAEEYPKHSKFQMRYVPMGTELGIKQMAQGSGDFGAGEAPLTESQRKDDGLIELPEALIGIVPIYNLPDVHGDLRLSGDVLADIFLGAIRTWNAPQIAKLNPDLSLPSTTIRVVYRPAGKGSNYVFTDFLSRSSAKFHAQIGVSPSPKWPTGEPAERSSDMADKVKSQPGSIGYVEYEYAVKDSIQQASVLNAAGQFVKASPKGFVAACTAVEAPHWNTFAASLAHAHGASSYPITSFTWIYLRTKPADATRVAALVDLLNWTYSDGQALADKEGYTGLPPQLVTEVKKKLTELY